MMQAGLALLVVGMLLCGVLPIYGAVLVGLFMAGMGKIVFDPAVQAFVGHRAPFERRGLAVGAIETAWAGSTLIGIPVTAVLINLFGLRWSFIAMAFLGGIGFVSLARVFPPDHVSALNQRKSAGFISAWRQLIRRRAAVAMMGVIFWISLANDNFFGFGLLCMGPTPLASTAGQAGGRRIPRCRRFAVVRLRLHLRTPWLRRPPITSVSRRHGPRPLSAVLKYAADPIMA